MPTVVSLIDPAARPTVLPEDALATLGEAGWTVIHRPWKRREAAQAAEWIGPNASAVLCTWGAPTFTPSLLDALPNLRFIGYCPGSVKHLVTPLKSKVQQGLHGLVSGFRLAGNTTPHGLRAVL